MFPCFHCMVKELPLGSYVTKMRAQRKIHLYRKKFRLGFSQ